MLLSPKFAYFPPKAKTPFRHSVAMSNTIKRRQNLSMRSLLVAILAAVLGLGGIVSGYMLVIARREYPRPLFNLVKYEDNPREYSFFALLWLFLALFSAFNTIFKVTWFSDVRLTLFFIALGVGLYYLASLITG
jgi:hypothetical protein